VREKKNVFVGSLFNKGINFHGRGSENTEKWRAKKKKKIVWMKK
jgi:hypothetical protein